MRAILFCANPYAFGILGPLYHELTEQRHTVLWFVPAQLLTSFPFKEATFTSEIKALKQFKSDAIFVPGNEVPYYLRGVKVQVFHGLAGEKQGHFRIRHYFDLYLTQGPYFTKPFEDFARRYKNFEVKETGWCKLDTLYQHHNEYKRERDELLQRSGKKNLLLYAPTFSPSLTSAKDAFNSIVALADEEDIFLQIKFHDLMDKALANQYIEAAKVRQNMAILEERNILKPMIMADLMISDTSSVVYEFILLNKPVITINSAANTINWCNISDSSQLRDAVRNELTHDRFKERRAETIQSYHPYTDGKSSARMIAATEAYIQQHGVPERRALSLFRKWKINKMFGRDPQ